MDAQAKFGQGLTLTILNAVCTRLKLRHEIGYRLDLLCGLIRRDLLARLEIGDRTLQNPQAGFET